MRPLKVFIILLLSGCATHGLACPQITEYSKETQAHAWLELQSLPQNSTLKEWVKDYGALRNQVRACNGE